MNTARGFVLGVLLAVAVGAMAIDTHGYPSRPSFGSVTITGTGGNVPTIVTGTFSSSISSGCTTTPSLGTVTYRIVDKRATLILPTNVTCTSNSTFLQINGLPAALTVATTCTASTCTGPLNLEDNGVANLAGCYAISGGILSFGLYTVAGSTVKCAGGGFTASGTKGFSGVASNTWSFTIPLN